MLGLFFYGVSDVSFILFFFSFLYCMICCLSGRQHIIVCNIFWSLDGCDKKKIKFETKNLLSTCCHIKTSKKICYNPSKLVSSHKTTYNFSKNKNNRFKKLYKPNLLFFLNIMRWKTHLYQTLLEKHNPLTSRSYFLWPEYQHSITFFPLIFSSNFLFSFQFKV